MPFLLLMPSYNQAHYIAEAVRSVLQQDDPDWELWILDNSTDDTPTLMRQFDDARIHFHHIPQRMDPGSCLNWMLERARGDIFSYVHTDNNLRPDFVRRLRSVLAGKPMGLAYCDMRVLNANGRPKELLHRGAFDLARLFSFDPLGVPFAATTALANAVGGFRANDLADDVRFCISAYGIAEFVHLREPLLDYRSHEQSRFVTAGLNRVRQSFLEMFQETRATLIARGGTDPVPALARAVIERFEDLEWFVEDLCYRRLSRAFTPWWDGGRAIDHLFDAGLLLMPGFSGPWSRPPRKLRVRSGGRTVLMPWQSAAIALYMAWRYRDLRARIEALENVLLPWAFLVSDGHTGSVAVAAADFRSLVTARLLERGLDWKPVASPGSNVPAWTLWGRADAKGPRLTFGEVPALSA